MTTRLWSELRYKECHDERAEHRHKNDPSSPGTWRCEQIGVVAHLQLPEKRNIVDQTNKITKSDRTESGYNPRKQGQH